MYSAQLDYRMLGFDLDARAVPESRCKLERMTRSTIMVDPGDPVIVQLVVSDRNSANQSTVYKVQVNRLRGTETTLKTIKIDHSIAVPEWDALVRNYTSYLEVDQDIVKIMFERTDSGQVVGLDNSLEESLQGRRRLQDTLPPPIGEVQYLPGSLMSTVDVGHQRLITVVVESADHSAVGRYNFKVQRPFCPPERRFFDGRSKKCTDICNEGSFGNPSTGRCSLCLQRHCVVCDMPNHCSKCSTGFQLQGNKCLAAAGAQLGLQSLEKLGTKVEQYSLHHVLLLVGASCVATAAVCGCIMFVMLSRQGRCGSSRPQSSRLIDSDDELSTINPYMYS
jgi:hypothetical protein